jgi:FxsC-like protein
MPEGLYFFLSYAHLPPATDADATDDPVVTEFFDDLTAEICRRVAAASGWEPGAYDRALPSDDGAVAAALAQAQVFVPLYSPRYLSGTWPMREYRSFTERLRKVDGDAADHIQPVLWVPLPPGQALPDGTDLHLADDSPDYAENGLRMLRELAIYRPQYDAVVGRLAQRIIDAAQQTPLTPSAALMVAETNAEPGVAQFAVAVAAPGSESLPAERRSEAYGRLPVDWRPFGHAQTAGRQAANVAERLGLPAAIVEPPDLVKAYENTPAVLLVDPWILAVRDGPSKVEETLNALPDWVTVIVLADEHDPQYAERGRELVVEAVDMLARAGAHRAPADPRSAADLESAMPMLVMQARRRFLHSRPRTGERPRLSGPDRGPGTSLPPTPGADDR